ncbi:MAG: hypothetical protein DMG26_08460 [Acidobacteria bacterium]|nr:MAG: hypothetical protein DMG25_20095 [Acidobacteriota bacterium]PYV03996.1 MAG: hypothetical protein DMG26_08460 [Acidobacteriota bacterium]
MSKEARRFQTICWLGFCLAPLAAFPAAAQDQASGPTVIHETKHDVSPPLRDIVASLPATQPEASPRVIPLRLTSTGSEAPSSGSPDEVLQDSAGPLVGTTNLLNFEGTGADGVAPPDTNGSVGGTQFVQIVNVEYAVYDKSTGGRLLGPTPINAIWNGFGGLCQTNNGGDPIVLYDKAAGRWLVSQLAYTSNFSSNFQCIAISTSSDATGSYFRYAFDFGSNLPDYPKFGVWPDAYYWSTNTFPNGGAFVGAQACAFNRASMLAGSAGTAICFQKSTSVASLLPSDLDGSTPPPSGEPNFFLDLSSTSALGLFKFHVDFATPSNSTFTGPTSIPVSSFSEACGGLSCIPQAGTTQQLDSLGDRLMYRLAYRNFGDHESLVVNHSVTAGSSVGVRWYEIRSPNASPTVFQQGTYAPDSTFRWMGSIGMDQSGDIAVGYSASSSSINPAIRYTGRVPGDPLGTLESENSIIEGTGSQTGGLDRWGDYSSISIDPSDDCTFWYTSEYLAASGSFNWHTRIGSFKFTSCGGAPAPDFSLSATPSSQTVVQGGSTSYTATVTALNGFTGTVTFSASGLPSGANASFNPPSVTGSGSSTMNVTTSSTTPTGTYTLTITGTSGSLVHTATVTLVVTAATGGDFSISASPPSQTVTRGASTTYTVTVTPSGGFTGTVTFSVSGLPRHATGSFSPPSVTGSGSSTLTVSTAKSTARGTFTLTLTGTSGSLTHSAAVTLTVN